MAAQNHADSSNENAQCWQAPGESESIQIKQPDSECEVSRAQVHDAVIAPDQGITTAAKRRALEAIRDGFPGEAASAQQVRMLAALRLAPVDTFEASRYLDVYYPPARIMALRKEGYGILTVWKYVPTECGRLHRIGNYVLTKETRDVQQ